MANFATAVESAAMRWPGRVAVVDGDRRLDYAELNSRANRVANLLSSWGVGPNDKVAVSIPNVAEFPIVYFGILKAGATMVPLNVLLTEREIRYHLADSGASAFFAYEGDVALPVAAAVAEAYREVDSCLRLCVIRPADSAFANLGDDVVDYHVATSVESDDFVTAHTHDDHTAVVLYTSGTTGQPKGAELRHRNIRDNAAVVSAILAADPDVPDVIYTALPLYHSFGQTVLQNAGIVAGATLVLHRRFDPQQALELIASEHVTLFAGVPTMFWALLHASSTAPMSSAPLRLAVSGGAPLPLEVHRQFEHRFGVTITEGYGLSETSPAVTFAPLGQVRVGSVGTPVPGVEVRLIDDHWQEMPDGPDIVGEIAVRGHNVMKGYFRRPQATQEVLRDGWFRTGDLARRDADGFYYIVDRKKDLIIRGGYNVYPREVEEVLMTHPAVSLVAVVGVPHPSHGQEVKAVIVRHPGAGISADELIQWARGELAAYKYPRIVDFVDSLPINSTGKVVKLGLR